MNNIRVRQRRQATQESDKKFHSRSLTQSPS